MKTWLLLLLLVIMFAFPQAALADMAPPYQPPGPTHSRTARAPRYACWRRRLRSMCVQAAGTAWGKAQVTADFTMRNLGGEAETMAVRFPISASDGRSNFPEIKNLQVKVNGNNVRTRRIEGEDPFYGSELVPWAEFDVSIPAGRGCAGTRYLHAGRHRLCSLRFLPVHPFERSRVERYDRQRRPDRAPTLR